LEGLLLGISSGAVCLTYCAPVLVTYLLGEGKSTSRNFIPLGLFLSGRLAGYILFGILAWSANLLILKVESYREIIFGSAYIVLSCTLIFYAVTNLKTQCPASSYNKTNKEGIHKKQVYYPLFLGFLTGINICPPFLLAFTGSAESSNLLNSILFFIMFFLGTTLYILPLSFLGFANKYEKLKLIAKFTAFFIAAYYIYTGAIMLYHGISFQ
jgi:sulfite exporter TauE/SafE